MKHPITATLLAALALGTLLAPVSRAEDAAALWAKHCSSCHGADGKGDTKPGKLLKVRDLTAADVHASLDRAKVRQEIEKGIVSPETGKTTMKGYGDKLSPAEMDALADYSLKLGSGH
jgi:mono/diheme cytochrome c family protein